MSYGGPLGKMLLSSSNSDGLGGRPDTSETVI